MTDRTVVPIDPVHTPRLPGPRRRTVPGGRIVDALGTTDAKRIGVLYLVTMPKACLCWKASCD